MSADSRLGNIGNILNGGAARPRLVPPPAPEAAPAPEPTALPRADRETAKTQPAKTERPAQRPTAGARRLAKKATTSAAFHRVPVRLDADLRDRLDNAARAREATFSEIAFDALEAAHHAGKLGALVEADTAPATRRASRPSGALFQRPQGRVAARPTVLTEFRLTTEDMAVLDSLVDEAEATSRSQLIKVALRHHLTG